MLKDKLKQITNNKYVKNYKPKKPSKCITYFDMNNFYGWVMISYLCYGRFKWLKNFVGFDVSSVSEKSPIAYIFQIKVRNCSQI